jgi:hypothetical protein
MITLIANIFRPTEVTRDDLDHLGGNPHFIPPSADRSQQIQQGQIPTAKQTALYWWGYWL